MGKIIVYYTEKCIYNGGIWKESRNEKIWWAIQQRKHNFEEFLILTFEFSEDELAAIDKQKPMTMELFSSCLAKCTEWGLYKLFERLLDEYPELSDKYVKAIEDDIKDVVLPERTPEEEEESWDRLCERIKKEYGDDLTCE